MYLLVIDPTAEAESFVRNLIKGLSVEDGSVLLAIMWVTKDGKRYHQKYPHVLGLDVTFGTNAEKRPLFRSSGKTSDNNNIPHVNAFIPSEQRWVFEWCLHNAMPSLLDANALRKTSIIITDQDERMVGTLLSTLRNGNSPIYGNAMNRLCKWHKVT